MLTASPFTRHRAMPTRRARAYRATAAGATLAVATGTAGTLATGHARCAVAGLATAAALAVTSTVARYGRRHTPRLAYRAAGAAHAAIVARLYPRTRPWPTGARRRAWQAAGAIVLAPWAPQYVAGCAGQAWRNGARAGIVQATVWQYRNSGGWH